MKKPYLLYETSDYGHICGQIWIARKKIKNIGQIWKVLSKKYAGLIFALKAALKTLNTLEKDPILLNFVRAFQKSCFQGKNIMINRVNIGI